MDPDLSTEPPAEAPPGPDTGAVPDSAPDGPNDGASDASVDDLIAQFQHETGGQADDVPPGAPQDADKSVDDLIAQFQREIGGQAADAPVPPSGSATPADIDALVADSPSGDVGKRLDGVMDWIRYQETDKVAAAIRADTEASIKFAAGIVGDVPGGEQAVRGLLVDMHNRDSVFRHAFAHRYQAPVMWRQALKEAAKDIRAELAGSRIDEKVTRDRETVAFAVRGQRGPATQDNGDDIDEAKVAKMTDAEYENWKGDLARKSRGKQ